MEWSQKRKVTYAVAFGVIALLVFAYPLYRVINPTPSCFDGRKNGGETGTDCGGLCARACLVDVKPLRVVWTKAFALGNGTYDLGAYVENTNPTLGVVSTRYSFRVTDSAGNFLVEKNGTTEVAPGAGFVLFEPRVLISGSPDNVEVIFDKDDIALWTKSGVATSIITTKNQNLKNVDRFPRFDATLVNTDLENAVNNLTVSAVIYDALRHPVAMSRTYVDTIPMGGTQDIFFTWPNRFSKHPSGGICTTPVDTVLVLDRSGSMDVGGKNPPEPLTSAKNAAITYMYAAEQVDKVGLVSFATEVTKPINQELTLDHEEAIQNTANVLVDKGTLQYTNLGEALRAAVVELQSVRHRKDAKSVIVALTDGITNRPLDPADPNNKAYPEKYAMQIADAARVAGIEMYTVGLGNSINAAFLRDRIATDPAHYFKAPTAASLEGIYKTISETVCKEEGFITDIVITPRAIFAK